MVGISTIIKINELPKIQTGTTNTLFVMLEQLYGIKKDGQDFDHYKNQYVKKG
ncbi:hypothetical protein ID856_16515 [Xenorhabdus sp. 18]|uniref:hypothetical protein n=1 Tax=Xenorhabdus doucetiae TaxID=351671 RepID=UPI0019A57EB2|nr:hypothetical protein [Xenorhabdus sp. 18]MBD2798114.1 hypothetical protein [Xenorhabdus sp. 18]